jgi:2-dehydropantoate 2-reductase
MRIAILGAGAIGGWLAMGLLRGGAQVGVLARGATLAALRARGLTLRHNTAEECHPVLATDDPAALADPDLLLLGLKGQDLPAALPAIRAMLGPRTLVVAVQNGLPWWFFQGFGGPAEGLRLTSADPDGSLAETLPAHRLLAGVAHAASTVEAPGIIRLRGADRMLFGDPSGTQGAALAALVATLAAGGIPAQAVPDIRTEIWAKLWGNSNMNPLSALCRADAAAMLDEPGVRGLVRAMMAEMAGLGARIGLPLPADPEPRIAVTRRLGAFRTSMLQDLEAGRRLELGPILSALVELAAHLGEQAPVSAGVLGLVRLLERQVRLGE